MCVGFILLHNPIALKVFIMQIRKNKRFLSGTFAAFLCLLISCSAPRNNPLDANNPDRQLSSVEGRVLSLSLPHRPVPETAIEFRAGQRLTFSNREGKFDLPNVFRYNGWLYFTKRGFHPDSVYLQWDHSPRWHGEVYLNALPRVDSLIFYSSLINRYPAIQILELFVRTRISDADKDIDSVRFESPSLGFSTDLVYDTMDRFYEKEHIPMAQLNVQSAEEIIGHRFRIIVKDSYGHSDSVCTTEIRRIIRDEVQLKRPAGHDTVSSTPTLYWEPVSPGYSFTYTVEVRTDEADPQLVWQKAGISPGTSSVQVDVPLPVKPNNNYIWAVWIIDSFGNRARSKFKSFQVK